MSVSNIKYLVNKVKDITQDQKYKELKNNSPFVPIYIGLGKLWFARKFNVNLEKCFVSPELLLELQLKSKIFQYEEVPDDSIIDTNIDLDFGVALEPSLFGINPIFRKNEEPSFGLPVIKKKTDLDKLQMPDFFNSGIMPQAHMMFSKMQDLVGDELQISFPGWARGPWGLACMLRGFTNLYIDLIDDPQFVHNLMQFLVDSKLHFEKERAAFLGIEAKNIHQTWRYIYNDYRKVAPSDLYNDEVDGALFSNKTYRKFIYPYEKQIANFHGGIRYYHSCGKLDSLISEIGEFPNLEILHVSPWTDLSTVCNILSKKITLQVVMHVEEDTMKADSNQMHNKLRKVIEKCKGRPFMLCVDGIYTGSIGKVKQWIHIARNELDKANLSEMIEAKTF